MPAMETVTVSQRLSVDRTCSICSARWVYTATFRGTDSDVYIFSSSASTAKAGEALNANSKVFRNNSESGVLCPACGGFAVEAVRKHFPAGFKHKLGEIVARDLRINVVTTAVCIVILAILGPLITSILTEGDPEIAAILVIGALLALFGLSLTIFDIPPGASLNRQIKEEPPTESLAREWLQRATKLYQGGSGELGEIASAGGRVSEAYSLGWIEKFRGYSTSNLYKSRPVR